MRAPRGSPRWRENLERWRAAGLLDDGTADRIAAFEEREGTFKERSARPATRWAVWVAVALGAIAVGAGVFLFVAAHWDGLSPAARFALVVLLVALFHGGGLASRTAAFRIALHALGTLALGAGVALTAQIFHLEEHWSGGALVWALGALAGWYFLRDWAQATLLSILGPAWLVARWMKEVEWMPQAPATPAIAGVLVIALVYLSMRCRDAATEAAIHVVGATALIPAFFLLRAGHARGELTADLVLLGWAAFIAVSLALGFVLRCQPWWAPVLGWLWAIGWVLIEQRGPRGSTYVWGLAGWVALVGWGIRQGSPLRINLGIAGFALLVLTFYFSNVMDRMGRSLSLIGLGVLFLGGGWLLERFRRRLIASIGDPA